MTDLSQERSARELMERFAHRTGLSPDGTQRRYLWTDAFAVVNYLTLFRRSDDASFAELARLLIDRVHHVLGRYRPDDARSGWISGLSETEGARHPTAGGLRIGKPLAERRPEEPFDGRLEWERDGQYYHYLLRWMHALNRAAAVLHDRELHRWAVELALVAERAFSHEAYSGAPPALYWKMSTDLSRPLVASQGAHDPLDGLVTACLVSAAGLEGGSEQDLDRAIRELAVMCRAQDWVTEDPLGAGGLLCDVWWTMQLLRGDAPAGRALEPVLAPMVAAAVTSLRRLSERPDFRRPASERLAFRELGLVIGLQAAAAIMEAAPGLPARLRVPGLSELQPHLAAARPIASTWLEPDSRSTAVWRAHEDINDVMLATALLPDEYLHA